MQRINTATKVIDLFGAGKHGFRDGDLVGGLAPTDFSAAWFNGVQEETLAVIESVGLVADANVLTQLRQAINRIAGRNIKTITAANSPYAVTADDAGLLLIDATAGNVVATMPAANAVKAMPFILRRVDTSANTVTINRAGADTLDGATSAPLFGGGWVHWRSDGVSLFKAAAASAGLIKFAGNGSITVPAGVTTMYASGCGGGGGGGGGAGSTGAASSAGGGGGGGAGQAAIRQSVAVTPGQILNATIGAGGATSSGGAASAVGTAGGAGGNTVLAVQGGATLLTLTGGSGGGFGGVGPASGGAGGSGAPTGGYGDDGIAGGGGGAGANGPYGGGGGHVRGSSGVGLNGSGTSGFGVGGGGGSACYAASALGGGGGAAGAPGLLILEW